MSTATPATHPRDVRVGVIGTGRMGLDHVQRLARRTKGAQVAAVTDFNPDAARAAAEQAPGARVLDTPEALITDPEVDAIIIASPGPFHREQTLAAIAAGKPVLCEKPLATSPEDAYEVAQADAARVRAGRTPLVSVGFMRRFDAEYQQLAATIGRGDLGEVMILNCKHRNASTLPGFTDASMVHDSAVHEIDAIGYLLGEPIVTVQSVQPLSSPEAPEGLHDPLLLLFRTVSGRLVTDELFVSTGAGYEVRTEAVGSRGTATIGLPTGLQTTQIATGGPEQEGGRWGGTVPPDFRPRFAAAYDAEVLAFIHAVADGTNVAPGMAGAWDGYVASAVCAAAESSLVADAPVPVHLQEKP
jgi:myo-inositol 2-dehydrogenase/D-chiro-inositol 1-dehydrogenase